MNNPNRICYNYKDCSAFVFLLAAEKILEFFKKNLALAFATKFGRFGV
jgi:hypothetical protein